MTKPDVRLSLEEVLDEFFYSADKPTSDQVLHACDAYPEYRVDIVEFAALWTSYEAAPEPIEVELLQVTREDLSCLQSFVLNRLHELDSAAASDEDVRIARAAIEKLAGGKLARATAAIGFGSSVLLLTKVLTTITDVPDRVIRELAQYLQVAPTSIRSCIGPQVAGVRSYKASRAPNAPALETWRSAVLSLPISDDEKNHLLSFQTEKDVH